MQFTIEVLPAPLGPMIENSSPSLMAKPTSVSARTPPNRKDTPRTSRLVATKQIPPGDGAFSGALRPFCRAILVRPCRLDHAADGLDRSRAALVPVWDQKPHRPRWSSIGESAILKCLPPDNSATKFLGGRSLHLSSDGGRDDHAALQQSRSDERCGWL